ncbi:MAG: hypothetical protein U0491_01030 [Candidatus Saccharimonadales bacterium]
MIFKKKPKQPKTSVIQNHPMSYLDKRSRSYHKIVMTAFTGVFGLAGMAYIFSSNAATPGTDGSKNSDTSLILLAVGLALTATVLIVALVLLSRRKSN